MGALQKSQELKFTTTFNGVRVNVRLAQAPGGGYSYHIQINNRHYGVVTRCSRDGWRVAPQKDDYFTEEQKDSMLIRLLRAGLIDRCRLKVLNIEDYLKK